MKPIIYFQDFNSFSSTSLNTLRLRQNGHQFPDNIFKCIFLNEIKQGKSEGFDSCDRPSNLTQIGLKSLIFRPCDLEILWMTPEK